MQRVPTWGPPQQPQDGSGLLVPDLSDFGLGDLLPPEPTRPPLLSWEAICEDYPDNGADDQEIDLVQLQKQLAWAESENEKLREKNKILEEAIVVAAVGGSRPSASGTVESALAGDGLNSGASSPKSSQSFSRQASPFSDMSNGAKECPVSNLPNGLADRLAVIAACRQTDFAAPIKPTTDDGVAVPAELDHHGGEASESGFLDFPERLVESSSSQGATASNSFSGENKALNDRSGLEDQEGQHRALTSEALEPVIEHVSLAQRAANPETLLPHEEADYLTSNLDLIKVDIRTLVGSALSMERWRQAIVYTLALGGVVFVLLAKSFDLGAYPEEAGDDGHRRLGGGASLLMTNIAFCIVSAGIIAFVVNTMKQPLILGYILGGVLVGPTALDIVHSHEEMAELSSLGLVFLLFMIGLELDISELFRMGKVVVVTGICQFPICATVMVAIFKGFEALGLSFGEGPYSSLYCGVICSISSTMIVVKLLSEMAEMDSSSGRLTVGILICQDVWAIVVLAIQPDLANPKVLGLLKTFGLIACLIIVALGYAKFVMPAVLQAASKSVELMLIMSLAWCFFMCSLAVLPFVNLSMELAALISGVALATFPYSAEFNGKIKYIRDFFITLFFVGLGMQIPPPKFEALVMALLVAAVVLIVRWLGIFLVVRAAGGSSRLAMLSTVNLSQISEFALVICALGTKLGHIQEDTLTIIIWTFALLAIGVSSAMKKKFAMYSSLSRYLRRRKNNNKDVAVTKSTSTDSARDGETVSGSEKDLHIVFLGFHRIAAMLVANLEHTSPNLLSKIHVIDFNEAIIPQLHERGVSASYGDISCAEVLQHSHTGPVHLVLSTIPDTLLRGVSNLRLLKLAKTVWPAANVIVTADTPAHASQLYSEGADYVLRVAKLCAERLHSIIHDHTTSFSRALTRHSLVSDPNNTEKNKELENMKKAIFQQYRSKDHGKDAGVIIA